MKRLQDFFDAISTNGGNIFTLFVTTCVLLIPLVLLSFYRPTAALIAVLTTTFSMFAGALVQSLRSTASRQQMLDRTAGIAPNPTVVAATAQAEAPKEVENMSWIQKAFYGSVSVLCITLAVCAICVTRDLHRTSVSAQTSLSQVADIQKSVHDVFEMTGSAESEIANLADTLNDISSDLRTHEDAQLKQAQDASAQLTTLFTDADTSVKAIAPVLDATKTTVTEIGAEAEKTLGASQDTLKAATADLTDPAIKTAVAQVGVSATNLGVATKEAAGAMTDVHTVTTYEAKQIMAPVSKAKTAVLFIAKIVGSLFRL